MNEIRRSRTRRVAFSIGGGDDDDVDYYEHQLRKRLLDGEDSADVESSDGERITDSLDAADAEELPRENGIPSVHRGRPLGRTSRKVDVDRKTFDLFKSRSMGRSASCEFSIIEQANDVPMAKKSFKAHRRREFTISRAPGHRSIFGLPVMSPFSKPARFWLWSMAAIDLTFTAFFVPYITAFMSQGDADAAIVQMVDFITGGIFLLDVFVKFHIGFVISCDYRTKVEMRGKHIAWYYFRHGGAWIDVISVLPSILSILVALMGSLLEDAPLQLMRYIRMIRIVRLIRALLTTNMFLATDTYFFRQFGPTTLYFTSVVYCLIILINFLGCSLYFAAVLENSRLEDTWISKYAPLNADDTPHTDAYHYLLGLYWAIATVTTVGYGDVTPETWVELLLVSIIMLTQIIIFGFMIGTMTEIVTNSMKTLRGAEKYKEKMENVRVWLMHYDIPEELVERVKMYYSQVWLRRQDIDENSILNDLPFGIRSTIVYSLIGKALESLPLFRYLSKQAIFKIASRMSPVVLYPGEDVAHGSQETDVIYVLEDGVVSVISSKGGSFRCSAPEAFGAGSVLISLCSHKPIFKWKLKTYGCCRLWCIKTDDVMDIANTYEGGKEALFTGFHRYMLERMSRFPDHRTNGSILHIELGKQLSAYCCDQLKKEFLKEYLSADDLADILESNGAPSMFTRPRSALSDDANEESSINGEEGVKGRRVVNPLRPLVYCLRQKGAHGAVEFIGQLSILGNSSISADMLEALIEKFGVSHASLAALGLGRSRQENYIPINSVLYKLTSCVDTEAAKPLIEEMFSRVFPRKIDASLHDVLKVFDADCHPDVRLGVKDRSRVTKEALSLLFHEDSCTLSDFIRYHDLVVLCVPDLEAFMNAVWRSPSEKKRVVSSDLSRHA